MMVTCQYCGYTWESEGTLRLVTCPACGRKTTRIGEQYWPTHVVKGRRVSLAGIREYQSLLASEAAQKATATAQLWVTFHVITPNKLETESNALQLLANDTGVALSELGAGTGLIKAERDRGIVRFLVLVRPTSAAVVDASRVLGNELARYGVKSLGHTFYNIREKGFYALGPGGPATAKLQPVGAGEPVYSRGARRDKYRVQV